MAQKFNKKRWMTALYVVLVICVVFNVFYRNFEGVLVDKEFYTAEFEKNGIYDKVPNADMIISDIVDYFESDDDSFVLDELSAEENSHLVDVKMVVGRAALISYIMLSIIGIALSSIWKYTHKWVMLKHAGKLLIYSGAVVVGIVAVGALLASQFNQIFAGMHQLLFEPGTWIFPKGSLLPTMLPKQFFYDAAGKILLSSFITAIVGLLFGWVLKNVSEKRSK